jgi:hypothetical protein
MDRRRRTESLWPERNRVAESRTMVWHGRMYSAEAYGKYRGSSGPDARRRIEAISTGITGDRQLAWRARTHEAKRRTVARCVLQLPVDKESRLDACSPAIILSIGAC